MRTVVMGTVLASLLLTTVSRGASADGLGSPPSGRVPILFNDRHVYAKPDQLRAGRVLAALVSGPTVLVPLRSMFEQMDATVAYDPASRRVTVTKPGVEVSVTVGVATVSINGDERPLDVPPVLIGRDVYVPVRVLSEAMGAYVQWIASRGVVAIRYISALPSTVAPAAPAATAAPQLAPTPVPVRPVIPPGPPIPGDNPKPPGEVFVVGDYLISPRAYDEFTPNGGVKTSGYAARVAADVVTFIPLLFEAEFTHVSNTNPGGFVTVIGRGGSTFVPSFIERNDSLSAHLGLQIVAPRIFIAASYLQLTNNYGYPTLTGIGGGLEKLPDLDRPFSFEGAAYYYPNVKGTCSAATCPAMPYTLGYRVLDYRAGLVYAPPKIPVFIEGGYQGNYRWTKFNAPGNTTQNGPYAGVGFHF